MRCVLLLLFIFTTANSFAQNDSVNRSIGFGLGMKYYIWNNDFSEIAFLSHQKNQHFLSIGTEIDVRHRQKNIKTFALNLGYRYYFLRNKKIINPHVIGIINYKRRRDEREYYTNLYTATDGYSKTLNFRSNNLKRSLGVEIGYGIDFNLNKWLYFNLNNTFMIQWDEEVITSHFYTNNSYDHTNSDNNPNRWLSMNVTLTLGYRLWTKK